MATLSGLCMEAEIASRYAKVAGLNVHYLAGGQGCPVLLVHGGGTDSASLSWKPSIGSIASSHRVFALDLPGYGRSDKPGRHCSTEYYIDFVDSFMNALGIEKASLIGISLGGGVCLGFALRTCERVNKLVLIDSYGLGVEIPGRTLGYLLVRIPYLLETAWFVERRSRWMVKWSLRSLVSNPEAVTEELVDEVWQLMREPGAGKAFISYQRNEVGWKGLRTEFADRLHNVAVPTLILHGAEDKLVPVSWAERAHRLIAGSELHVFPKCGHWLPREKTGEFVQVVLQFLRKAG